MGKKVRLPKEKEQSEILLTGRGLFMKVEVTTEKSPDKPEPEWAVILGLDNAARELMERHMGDKAIKVGVILTVTGTSHHV